MKIYAVLIASVLAMVQAANYVPETYGATYTDAAQNTAYQTYYAPSTEYYAAPSTDNYYAMNAPQPQPQPQPPQPQPQPQPRPPQPQPQPQPPQPPQPGFCESKHSKVSCNMWKSCGWKNGFCHSNGSFAVADSSPTMKSFAMAGPQPGPRPQPQPQPQPRPQPQPQPQPQPHPQPQPQPQPQPGPQPGPQPHPEPQPPQPQPHPEPGFCESKHSAFTCNFWVWCHWDDGFHSCHSKL